MALAATRAAYGALSRLISRARRASVKGSYALERADLPGALPGCLILWLPPDGRTLLPRYEAEGRWLREHFAGRLWICSRRLAARSACRGSRPATSTCTGAAAAPCRTSSRRSA